MLKNFGFCGSDFNIWGGGLGGLFAPDGLFFCTCSRRALAKSCKSCKLGRLRREGDFDILGG